MIRHLLLIITLAGSVNLVGQDAKKIFDAERIVFYGLDFSKARISIPDAKDKDIKDELFVAWNQMVVTDNERFNKESAFQKLKIFNDLTVVDRRNAAVNIKEMSGSAEAGGLSKDEIARIISDYTDGMKTEGVGFVFVVESMSKIKTDAVAHAVFFDIATRKVLLSKRLNAAPGGPGLKNYWTRPFQEMFKQMTGGLFDMWRKEVLGK